MKGNGTELAEKIHSFSVNLLEETVIKFPKIFPEGEAQASDNEDRQNLNDSKDDVKYALK